MYHHQHARARRQRRSRHICSPAGTPKIRSRARGPPSPFRTQGSRRLSPASVIPVGRPLWCLGTREVCTVGPPSILGSGPWPEARPRLKPLPRPLPLILLVAVAIFYGEGLQAPPQPAGEALPGTLVSLAAHKGGRQGTAEEGQRGESAMGGRGHSLLTWKESTLYFSSEKRNICNFTKKVSFHRKS